MTTTGVTAAPAPAATHIPRAAVDVVSDVETLMSSFAEIAALADHCGAPVTARGAWLQATLATASDDRPWAVLARDHTGELVGAVVLLDQVHDLHETVVLAGTNGGGYRGAVLTRSASVAHALGQKVGEALLCRRTLPDVELGPLPAQCRLTRSFFVGLGGRTETEVLAVPVVRRRSSREVTSYLSHGTGRTLRKAANRLARDGATATVSTTSEPSDIAARLPELERCHQERDHAHGRASDLDDDQLRRLWRNRIEGLAAAGQVELATLHVDDHLAAYVLGVIDGRVYRLMDGRFITRWARYSPGRLLEATVLQRILDDPTLTTLDWMSPVASDTLLAHNDADPTIVVRLRRDL